MRIFSHSRTLRLCLALFCLLTVFPLQADVFDGWRKGDGLPDPPEPPRLVNDFASVMPLRQRDSLERVLTAFDDSTSNQICIVTMSSLGGREIVEYGTALGNKWGVGSRRNNGVLLLLKVRSPQIQDDPDAGYVDVAILPGRGLEGAIPDVYAARIIRNIMGPRLKKDEYVPALAKACAELMALASGEISEPRDGVDGGDWGSFLPVFVFLFIILLIVIARSKDSGGSGGPGSSGGGRRPPVIFWGGGSGRGSGGSFGGGSFGGGFGGFGGGSFGGGGASGRF